MDVIWRISRSIVWHGAMIIVFLAVVTTPALCDVESSPDNSDEDLAGVGLIAANVAVSTNLLRSLHSESRGGTLAGVSMAIGLGTVALGATETTSYSPTVTVLGVTTTVLAVAGLIESKDSRDMEPGERSDVSRRSVGPWVAEGRRGEVELGVLFLSSF